MGRRGTSRLSLMRVGIAVAGALCLLILLLPATQASGGTARETVDCPGARSDVSNLTEEGIRSRLICVVNRERTIRGLPALVVDPRLQAASQKYLSGITSNPNAGDRMTDEGYQWFEYARLGAGGQRTVFDVVQAHLAIQAECYEILSPRYIDAGVGFAFDPNGGPIWEQLLALEDDLPGDNTVPQDACPQALLGNYGPPGPGPDGGPAPVSPRARIVSARPLTVQGNRARIRIAFRSARPLAGFKCRLDRKPLRFCRSPKRIWVGRGTHVFRVFTVRRSGQLVTPAARVVIRFTNRSLSITRP